MLLMVFFISVVRKEPGFRKNKATGMYAPVTVLFGSKNL
jgi:hypothetical protein